MQKLLNNSVRYFFTLVLFLFCYYTKAQLRISSYENLAKSPSYIDGILFRNIGPTIMSGRVTDISVNPANPNEFYVAYASGGVFHTTNNGLSFTPIFDHEATLTVGAIAMDWNTHTLWVGTGEVNSSRSSYAGVGMYKSTDTGKHWIYCGLPESHHIGKIVLHPSNSQIAWVAVLGHLYTPNTERGIYKTIDGGQNWKNTLYVNDTTGCVDLILHPSKNNVLYATSWTRVRHAWNFSGAGSGSAIWKSEDAGDTWKKITNGDNGFPQGAGVGRIGVAMSQSNSNIIYAVLDNNFNQAPKNETMKMKAIKARDILAMTDDAFLNLDNAKLSSYLKENGYPEKYNAAQVKLDVKNKKYSVKEVAEWKLADADNNLFDTPILGAELYRSDDEGATWKKTHSQLLNGLFFTYGYYFANVAVSPTNANKIILGGYTCIESTDGGKSFKEIAKENCHADYHRVWMNEKNDNHIIVGNDGGINITYNNGEVWYKANNPAVGQFYAVTTDNAKPFNVYGGLQDNGSWTASSETVIDNEWTQSGVNPYKAIGDGDGMQVQVDTRDNATIYTGYQFGNYFRSNKNSNESAYITPSYDIGEKPLRFNWQTPILLSRHNQDILYMGSNCFHRSMHQGNDMKKMSSDLTSTTHKGNIPYGTLTAISESPLKFGLLLCGTDDGQIWKSNDVGDTWENITANLPKQLWCTRVVASAYQKNKFYCTLNGYRNDDFNAYVYVTTDAGITWKSISASLPQEPVNVIKEDPKLENILYIGTDNGLYVSMDTGLHFSLWKSNLPRVAIHDIAIQARDNKIVLGTHGRSLYVTSLDYVQQASIDKNTSLKIYPLDTIKHNTYWGTYSTSYTDAKTPTIPIYYFSKFGGDIRLNLYSTEQTLLKTEILNAVVGINSYHYNGQIDNKLTSAKAADGQFYLQPGLYTIEIIDKANNKASNTLYVKETK